MATANEAASLQKIDLNLQSREDTRFACSCSSSVTIVQRNAQVFAVSSYFLSTQHAIYYSRFLFVLTFSFYFFSSVSTDDFDIAVKKVQPSAKREGFATIPGFYST